jgi:hypothetical protein
VKRTKDGGANWDTIGLSGIGSPITGMAQDPNDFTKLYVSTVSSGTWRIDGVRGTAQTQTRLTAAPARVEEIAAVGGRVYAAAYSSGIYELTNSGATWTPLGGTFFTSTGSLWCAIGGKGTTLFAGCAEPNGAKSIAKSTNGGSSWTWVTPPSAISLQVWGRTENWWLGLAEPRVVPGNGGTYVAAAFAVDNFNSNIVYVAGRSGCWKSADGGATWRPAMNGLGGTMHERIVAATSGAGVWTDDLDWIGQTTGDHFFTATRDSTLPAMGGSNLSITKGGITYQVVLSVIRDIKVGGVSAADEFFRATCVRPIDIDVSADGNYIYIAQYGGGVIVGHKSTAPWP